MWDPTVPLTLSSAKNVLYLVTSTPPVKDFSLSVTLAQLTAADTVAGFLEHLKELFTLRVKLWYTFLSLA